MRRFVHFLITRRGRFWAKRHVILETVMRFYFRIQYRSAGFAARFFSPLAPMANSPSLKKMTNPFIEYYLGRLALKPAPINTLLRETYAQCSEDIIVEGLLRAECQLSQRSMSSIRYLEIGGNHPVQTSSTYLFSRAWGAKGYIVEANARLAERLSRYRPDDQIFQLAVSDSYDEWVTFHEHELDELSSLSSESILTEAETGILGEVKSSYMVQNLHINDFIRKHINEPIDYLSIDIEGLDIVVLTALTPDFQPLIIQAECYSDETLRSLLNILTPRGYVLVAITDVNSIFYNSAARSVAPPF